MNTTASSLETYIRAGYPILYLVTPEEDRAIDIVCDVVKDLQRPPYLWSVSRGLCDMDYHALDRRTLDPKQILPYLMHDFKGPGVFILEDFHFFLDERSPTAPTVIRQLRDVVQPFKGARKTILILSPVLKIPMELEKDITVVDLDMPGAEDLLKVLRGAVNSVSGKEDFQNNLQKGDEERLVQAMTGLTLNEAENALYKVIAANRRIDVQDIRMILAEKEQIIRKSGTLEYYSTPEDFNSVGGLNALKKWLAQRRKAFSEEARLFGLPNPRGLLLVGVPGCGKSLSAKAVASEWQMPLLRFDLGKVFQSLVGQAEENMRRALKMAEGVAPCILWIDEIEKGLAGASPGAHQGDGGVSSRVFGTLLTWMEENRKPVFTIATANNIDAMPPELLRKGRFDDIFFIDLPSPLERAYILGLHLAKRFRELKDFDFKTLVERTEGYSGAELEQVVVSALYEAFDEGADTPLADEHLLAAIGQIKPMSITMGPKIAALRQKAGDWRRATLEEEQELQSDTEVPSQSPWKRQETERKIF